MDPSGFNNYDIDFGEVPVGTTSLKLHQVKNPSYNRVTYYVTRSTQTNPIYYAFDVNKYEFSVKAGAVFQLKIMYNPNLPGHADFDYFTVTDNKEYYFRLRLKGECLGPSVGCSVKNLIFFRTPKRRVVKLVFTITNNSVVPAIYNFDCAAEEQGLFKVEPTSGTLASSRSGYVTIRFIAQTPGIYSRQLFCLVLQQEPIVLNLFGVCSNSVAYDKVDNNLRFYPFPYAETVGFRGYFSDSVTVKRVPPPVSLTVNFLDFGRMMPECSCQTLTTSLTNHLSQDIEVDWENISHFRVYPEKLTIPPQQSVLYECRFQPDEICKLSMTILHGYVSWKLSDRDDGLVNAPIPISLRLIGHSFPDEMWIPSITIPSCVVLPLSIPSSPCWTTFLIKVNGHLPVLYKLIPPRHSNFIMKPMIGLIKTHQVVAVQLEANTNQKKSFIEQWQIELNGRLQESIPLYVKAQTDIPDIKVSEDNLIYFGPMQPGTQSILCVPLRNTSNCCLLYDFELNEQFTIQPQRGVLAPNEEIFVTASYTSNLHDSGVRKISTCCQLRGVFGRASLVGELWTVPITVIGDVVFSELCALPQSYECKEVEWNAFIETCFYLFNFGQTNINFKLCHNHDLKDVVLYPEHGRCGPREKLVVKVQFTVRVLGKNCLMIGYKNRFSEYSYDSVGNEGVKIVFKLQYNCLMPILQIVGLEEHNYSLFSNQDLWRLLNIDNINAALAETNQGEIRRVDLRVPEFELGNKLFYLIFTLKNVSKLSLKLKVKRRQVCGCRQKTIQNSFTFRGKYFDCPHRDLCEIGVSETCLPSNSNGTFRICVRYLLPEQNILSYTLQLCHERTVILNILISSVSPEKLILSVYDNSYTLDVGFVYIGLRAPPVFAYWLHNPTSYPVAYILDDTDVVKLCNKNQFPVLKCLNSTGYLQPFTRAPLLFKFWPIEAKLYKISVPLLLGQKPAQLTFQGHGTAQKSKIEFKAMRQEELKPVNNNVLSLSVDHLITEPLIVSTSTERMLFIRLNKTKLIQFTWKPCCIDGIVNIEASPSQGVIQNNESLPVVVKISSLQEPCSLWMSLQLEFVDFHDLTDYNKNVSEKGNWSRLSESRDSQFLQEPRYFVLALPIFVNIVGSLDRDNCITVEDQMRQQPWSGAFEDVDEFVATYFEKRRTKEAPIRPVVQNLKEPEETTKMIIDKKMTEEILEQLIGDAVHSNYFLEILKSMKSAPSPLYSQIKLSIARRGEEREEHTKKTLRQPPLPEVASVCQKILLDSLKTVFRTGSKRRSINK